MKRLALGLVLILAASAIAIAVLLPPQARILPPGNLSIPIRGAIHVHSRRSDGSGTVEDIAAAARQAGIQFVILTDHGDGTREPEPPRYLDSVLCIDAVEISTDGGHVVALRMPRAPYPLGGEPRDVLEDIARLGGLSIAAHPGSAKPALRWLEWTAPFDGLEWLNGDSEWRDETRLSLARGLLTYPFRPPETMAALLDRPDAVLARWDALLLRRRVVAVAAADAHARLGSVDEGGSYSPPGAAILRVPSYEQMFRTFSIALPDLTFTGDAATDAAAVIERLAAGRVYSSIDALAAPGILEFHARIDASVVPMGGEVPTGTAVTFHVATNGPQESTIVLLKNGTELQAGQGSTLMRVESGEPAVYRVEVRLSGAPGSPSIPWMLSNPIYVRDTVAATATALDPRGEPTEFAGRYEDGFAEDWTVESSPRSQGGLDVAPTVGGTQLSLRYALGGTRSESPYVALIMPAQPGLSSYDRLRFTARSTRPMRLSVQMRIPDSGAGERWHRSVYLDEMPRAITVAFDDMTPRGATTRRRPVLSSVRDILFVVDTVNTEPGAAGQIWIDDVRYAR